MAKNTLSITDLRIMSEADLLKTIDDRKQELVEKHRSLKAGELANPNSIRNLKRQIARINTILKENRVSEQEKK